MAYRQKFNFGNARTVVFWDTVACPVPEGLDAETVVRNIHLGLCKRGYLHLSKVKVYGNVPEMAAGAFATAGLPMSHVPPGIKGACRKAIFVDFMYELIGRRDAVNTLLILEDISEDEAFEYAFMLLRMERNFNFLLARPNKESETKNIVGDPNVWLWSDLSNEPDEEEEEEEEEEEPPTSLASVAEDDDLESAVSGNVVVGGLDQTIINSYPKFLFTKDIAVASSGDGGFHDGYGEGGDTTCSICLCEYMEEEMVRMMPECKHYFHVYCLDAWLKLNGSCPVCRNSPLPTASI